MQPMQPQRTFWRNLRDFPSSLTLSAVVGGLLVVLVGYTAPVVLIIAAAQAGGLTDAQTASWLWAATVSNGLMTLFFSFYYRQPIIAPWSTAGVVLLTSALATTPLAQAVGAYIVCALLIMALGVSGLFTRLMSYIPQQVVSGLLAGILLRFGLGIFQQFSMIEAQGPYIVGAMIVVFFALKRVKFAAPSFGALVAGLGVAGAFGLLRVPNVTLALTVPQIVVPVFDLGSITSLSIPLAMLALTSQYAIGQAVLKGGGYAPPMNGILTYGGIASAVFALFGGHGVSLGALTAALVATPDAHPDVTKRYSAAVVSGIGWVVFGLFGGVVVDVFAVIPKAVVDAIAGLALLGIIGSALADGLGAPHGRDGALIAFLCAASGITFLGISGAFWGLLFGTAVHLLLTWRRAG
jgi:benzoate membrane transport protein